MQILNKKANKLSSLIADISNSKDKIAQAQKSVTDNEVKISIIDFKKKKLESELTGLIVNQSIISKDASNLFESLFTSEYDLALLDMHLTKESEGKNIPQMDGFQILKLYKI
ncbi:MAG: hypothetical protein IPP73_10225 [Chitinophagaceae bacterium]|nr:hypothetical protein [Chitinophagaceae bacterium]